MWQKISQSDAKTNNKWILICKSKYKARFPLGNFFRAKRLFPLSASLITSANAMPTKEKVASREKSRLVENGLDGNGWNLRLCVGNSSVDKIYIIRPKPASVVTWCKYYCIIQARFLLGDFFRAKRLFPLLASLITSANAMPTKEKVASREKSRLVENGLKSFESRRGPSLETLDLVFSISAVLHFFFLCQGLLY